MSHLMDYGDWPAEEAERFTRAVDREKRAILRKRRKFCLWQKAVARVVVFAAIWAAGAIVLHLLVPAGNRLDFPAPPKPAVVSTH